MENIEKIIDLQLEQVNKKVLEQGYDLHITKEARSFLARKGYDPAFGARPLKRTIQRLITNPLASRILEGSFDKGKEIYIAFKENSLDFAQKSV